MNNYIILAVSVLVSTANNMLMNVTGKRSGLKSISAKVMYNAVLFAVIFFGILIFNGGFTQASTPTVMCGVLYGMFAAVTYVTSLLAYASGPMNFTVLIVYCVGLLIPTVLGPIIWTENNAVTLIQWIGVALLIVSLVLGLKSSDGGKFNFKWLIFALLSAVTCGMLGIVQQAHQKSDASNELNMMLIIAFGTAIIIALIYSLISSKHDKTNPVKEFRPVDYGAAIGSGLCLGFANVANLFLSGALPAIIFFPIVNGGLVILSTIMSLIVFKEKLNLRQSIGVVLGIISLMLICGIV